MSRLEAWLLAIGLIILGIAAARAGDVLLDPIFGSQVGSIDNINM